MKMAVVDQLHVSSVGPEVMGKGTEFEVSDDLGAQLEKAGLATPVAGAEPMNAEKKPAVAVKAEAAPMNKAEEAAPLNKREVPADKREFLETMARRKPGRPRRA